MISKLLLWFKITLSILFHNPTFLKNILSIFIKLAVRWPNTLPLYTAATAHPTSTKLANNSAPMHCSHGPLHHSHWAHTTHTGDTPWASGSGGQRGIAFLGLTELKQSERQSLSGYHPQGTIQTVDWKPPHVHLKKATGAWVAQMVKQLSV